MSRHDDVQPPELPPDVPTGPRIADIRHYRGSFIGMVGLVCVPFLVWGAHDVYGVGWSIGLTVWWLFLLSVAITWFTPYPRRMPWLAVLGIGAWLVVVLLGRS